MQRRFFFFWQIGTIGGAGAAVTATAANNLIESNLNKIYANCSRLSAATAAAAAL